MGCGTSRSQSRWTDDHDQGSDDKEPDGTARIRRYSPANTIVYSREGSFMVQERVDNKVVGVSRNESPQLLTCFYLLVTITLFDVSSESD